MLFRTLVLSVLALSLSACNLSGTTEKGPFKRGSSVTFSKLNAQANPIASKTKHARVYANNGAYSMSNIRWSGWGQLQVSGKYFNEFTGNTSGDAITLNAITRKDRTFDTANIHLFSHLAAVRIKQRVANGQSRIRAWKATQREMKQLFGLKRVSQNIHRGVEQLSLLRGSGRYRKDNASLLLFTGSFLAAGGDAASLELLTTDFADDAQFNGVGSDLFDTIAIAGARDGLLADLSNNLKSHGVRNPPNNGDMSQLPSWVNQDVEVDDVPPVVTVEGTNPVIIVVGTPYVDGGATAVDNVDGELSASAIHGSDVINTSTVGTHTVTYNATDAAGNVGSATRTVNVVEAPDTLPPVITLQGDNPETLEVLTGEVIPAYQDPGYNAIDNRDGEVVVLVTGTVDRSVLGMYVLTYSATDVAGNDVSTSRTVEVVDTTDPVITLNGSGTVEVVAGSTYEDAGASVSDNYYSEVDLVITGSVDTETVGTYTLTYTATDGSNNVATTTRTVTVTEALDETAPVITLVGDATVTVEAGTAYTDAGATATDNKDGDLTDTIAVSGSVNVNVPATYVLTYNVKDAATNPATEVTRTVTVKDTTVPVITLTGESEISFVEGTAYTDAGAIASDSLDGDISANIVTAGDTVDATTPGIYIITYNVIDNAQNPATQVTRTVTVTEAPDEVAPVITLLGDASVTVEAGTSYTDAGATALDNKDGDLTDAISVSGSVNVNVSATYVLTYNVKDAATNEAQEVTRTVIVKDTINPVITLTGQSIVSLVQGDAYTEDGATASDSFDGDITANIVIGGDTVNTTTPGTYTITYNVMDNAKNPATQATRTVIVTAINHPPVAINQTITVDQDSNAVTITLTGTDADAGDTLEFSTTNLPAHGTLDGTIPNVIYKPSTGYSGTDSFNFSVTDGTDTATGVITINVTSVITNQPPVANAGSDITVRRGDTFTLTGIASSDSDGTINSYSWVNVTRGFSGNELSNEVYFEVNTTDFFIGQIMYYQLTVTDDDGATATDNIEVNISPALTDPKELTFSGTNPFVIETGTYADERVFYNYLKSQLVALDYNGNPVELVSNDEYFQITGYSGLDKANSDIWGDFDPNTAGFGIVYIIYSDDYGNIIEYELDVIIKAKEVPSHEIPVLSDAEIEEYLNTINMARSQARSCGVYGDFPAVPPVTWSDKLYKAAYEHSQDMTTENYFEHAGSGKASDWSGFALNKQSTMVDRIGNYGYEWMQVSENITAGTNRDTAQKAIDSWLASDGHCKNMMNADVTEVGMALSSNQSTQYTHYWTQNFARSSNVPPPVFDNSVLGKVTSTTGEGLAGVSIKVLQNGQEITAAATVSNADGSYGIDLPPETDYIVKFSADGYINQLMPVKTLAIRKPVELLDISLAVSSMVQPLENTPLVSLSGADGAKVSLSPQFTDPQGNTVDASDGVNLVMTPIDVSSRTGIATFPGGFIGISQEQDEENSGRYPKPIFSYGAVEYIFTRNSDGALLQLANGEMATIEIPLYKQNRNDGSQIVIGNTIPLWYLNENTGKWVAEGTGTVITSGSSPTGLSLQAQVSHFSIHIVGDYYDGAELANRVGVYQVVGKKLVDGRTVWSGHEIVTGSIYDIIESRATKGPIMNVAYAGKSANNELIFDIVEDDLSGGGIDGVGGPPGGGVPLIYTDYFKIIE